MKSGFDDILKLLAEKRQRPFPVLLDTARPSPGRTGGITWLGSDPWAVVCARDGEVVLHRQGVRDTFQGDPFEALRDLLRDQSLTDGFPGLASGYFGYDLGRHIERLPETALGDQSFPDLFIALYDDVTRIDTATGKTDRLVRSGERARACSPEVYRKEFFPPAGDPDSNFTREQYLSAVEKAREYIGAGDIYQVNLSQRFAAEWQGDPVDLYARLRRASPAPFCAFLELGNRALLSSSPELFLRVEGRHVKTRPIKGTRPRGADDAEDERLRKDLLESPKDDAELAMIVDLERNDLGRICTPGSVRVTHLKSLETHPTVFHLSATVEGTLREEIDPVDVLQATFPGGSITGAPKIRAMEIIDELEPTRRTAYTGAIGCISLDGDMTLNIAIRTMLLHESHVTWQAGGAIVWDSDPEGEYEETLVKARGMKKAIGEGISP